MYAMAIHDFKTPALLKHNVGLFVISSMRCFFPQFLSGSCWLIDCCLSTMTRRDCLIHLGRHRTLGSCSMPGAPTLPFHCQSALPFLPAFANHLGLTPENRMAPLHSTRDITLHFQQSAFPCHSQYKQNESTIVTLIKAKKLKEMISSDKEM